MPPLQRADAFLYWPSLPDECRPAICPLIVSKDKTDVNKISSASGIEITVSLAPSNLQVEYQLIFRQQQRISGVFVTHQSTDGWRGAWIVCEKEDPESSKRHRCRLDESLLKSCWRRGTEGPTAYIHPFALYSKQTGFVSAQQWYTSYWLCLVFLCCCCSVSTQRDGRLSLKLRDIIKLNTNVCEHAAFKLFLRLETPKSQNVWNAADVVICRAFYHARLSTLGSITNEIFLLRRPSGEIWWFPLSVRLYFFPGLFILLIPLTFFCLSLLFLFFHSCFLVCPDSSHAPLLLPPFVLCRLRAQNVDTLLYFTYIPYYVATSPRPCWLEMSPRVETVQRSQRKYPVVS